jgi:UDP-glucose 4-epimerase
MGVPPPPRDQPDRTAAVTGGAGFIGSRTVEMLIEDGWAVVAVDDLSTGSRQNLPSNAHLDVLDVSDRRALDRAIDAAAPSVIFHLAAQASVTRSIADPERDCEVNVHGTLNVLQAASRHGASVVFTSTGGALYGNAAPIPTTEEWSPAPVSPYGASKWAAEAYVNTWREATGLPHSVCRLGNVYGPRQNPHGEAGVVAVFSHLLWRGRSPTVFGFGKPTRDYVHVDDVARALLAAAGHGGTFNISTGTQTDVMAVFEMLQKVAGTSLSPEPAPLRAGELRRSCIDPGRAETELGWRAEIGLREGLEQTFEALVRGFEAATPPPGSVRPLDR